MRARLLCLEQTITHGIALLVNGKYQIFATAFSCVFWAIMGCCSALNCCNKTSAGYRLFRFPSDICRRAIWHQNCRRDNWNPTSTARLCEDLWTNMENLHNEQLSNRRHVDLVSAVSQLDAKQRVASPTRRELSFHVSEFDLSHTEKAAAQENKLMKTVWQKQRLGENDALSKTLKFAHQKVKTLNHPLQGPAAVRVQRSIGFQNVKKRLNSWSTIVQSNRNAEQLRFPLGQSAVSFQTTDDVISKWKSQTQTPLEQEISTILNGSSAAKQDEQEEKQYKLDLKELAEYRKEMAKLRALQSYMAAKAKQQKKIKSKRYHRILRSECTKKQLKEFETLRKVNSEAALKQLEKLEHARVEERASLRHRNTGKWAHNKAVRAKYDTESRRVLMQQLEISRELTQKNKMGDSSEDEDDEEDKIKEYKHEISCNDDNPWVGMQAIPQVGNYRKYWHQRNHSLKKGSEVSNSTEQLREVQNGMSNTHSIKQSAVSLSEGNRDNSVNEVVNIGTPESQRNILRSKVSNYLPDDSKKYAIVTATSGSWIVTPTANNVNGGGDAVDLNISNQMEQKLIMKVVGKAKKFEGSSFKGMDSKAAAVDSDKEEINELALNSKVLAFMDEELIDDAQGKVINKDLRVDNTNTLSGHSEREKEDREKCGKYCNVDPNKVITMKPKYLLTQLPAEISNGDENLDDDEESDAENEMNITEAFTEDDVIAEFRKEKEEKEKSQPEDTDLSLPGWGEWTGKSLKCSRKKKRSFVIKAPRVKLKNFNKGNIIISDKEAEKVHLHQVNELPPTFSSVKDFEASIRAPLGNTWIPQTAYRKLTAPSVVTKLGSTIKPLDQDVLLNDTK